VPGTRGRGSWTPVGLIVWIGSNHGRRPSARSSRHGYSEEAHRAPSPPVPARRRQRGSGRVPNGDAPNRPLSPRRLRGAVVAPILSPDGCIGAFVSRNPERRARRRRASRALAADLRPRSWRGFFAAAARAGGSGASGGEFPRDRDSRWSLVR